MAARRPRPADPAAAHEETNMWNGILVDLRRAREINTRSREVTRQAIEMETTLGRGRLFSSEVFFTFKFVSLPS